jgi:hypothetical protein
MEPGTAVSLDADSTNRIRSRVIRVTAISALVFLLATVFAACGGDTGGSPSSSNDDGSETDNTDRTLAPDGIAITEAAVIVAPEYTGLDTFVAVQSTTVSGVTDETPLPPEAQHVGDLTVEITAGRNVDISTNEQGLYVIVPVPASFEGEASELAVAARTPAKYAHIGPAEASSDHFWSVQPGYYVPQANAFAFPLQYLMAEGSEFALVKSSAYNSRTLEFPDRDFGVSDDNSTDQQGLDTARHPLIHKTKVGKTVGKAVKSVADAIGQALEDVGEEVSEEVKDAMKKVADTVEQAQKCVDNKGWKTREHFRIPCRSVDCTQAHRDQIRAYLDEVHGQFRPDFNRPDLTRSLPCRKLEVDDGSGGTETVWGRFYNYQLREQGEGRCSGNVNGMYMSGTNTGFTCYDGSNLGNSNKETTRQEYFHAVQYNYPPISWTNWADDVLVDKIPTWAIEGTASPVDNEFTTPDDIFRTSRDLRNIDTPLTEETGKPEYAAYKIQDFWIYLVNARNSTPKETFLPLFKQQSGMPNEPELAKVRALYDVSRHHWGWVRNQAFESRVTDGYEGKLNGSCVPNSNTWGSLLTTIQYDVSSQNPPLRRTLRIQDGWTAGVAKIEINNNTSTPTRATVSVDGQQPVKLYRARNSANNDCLDRNEPLRSSSLEDGIAANSSQTYFLLMDNARSASNATFDLTIDHLESNGDKRAPVARIVEPAPGSDVDFYSQSLRADAMDPGGGPIATYDWKVIADDETIDDVDDDGQSPATDGNPISFQFPESSTDINSVTFELTVTDTEGDSVTVRETRNNFVCRTLYYACIDDGDCCSGICGNDICVGT